MVKFRHMLKTKEPSTPIGRHACVNMMIRSHIKILGLQRANTVATKRIQEVMSELRGVMSSTLPSGELT